jgi:hypothetical protein
MNFNSSIFDRIRISQPEEEPAEQGCDHPGCARPGPYRAPQGRNREGRFFHFCLDHVRAYNQSYNYFKDMPDEAVRAYQKEAVTGHRPTWQMGLKGSARRHPMAEAVNDPFEMFGNFRPQARPVEPVRRVSPGALQALEKLGLDEQATREQVRAQFKTLAKRFHPDLNGGDRSREEKLRSIIDAYNYLKSAGLA